ncbi:hypothetical protein NL341_26315, partial [Klebsiella pneumoniae]|nr:hypothetical protein [Klebsiella pneumoniae]
MQRVLGGENISQEDYEAAAQGVKELRKKALALLGDAPIILTPTLDSGPLKWSDITPENTAESAVSLRRWTEPF